ncbi:YheC/YheD family protein [Effusibacillus consociatus]|uniref:YheC/YheD family protein n=1 Tax=Effusibacillus consociatus TaxID=1117041 RepID=A0ABV9Q2A0_9BACL
MQKADLGVLVDDSQLNHALAGRHGFEYLPFYTIAAEQAGANVVFFSPRMLPARNGKINAFTWDRTRKSYQLGEYEIPPAIHNRIIFSKSNAKRVRALFGSYPTILYNGITRFDKWEVHQHLSKNPDTSQYLPVTAQFSSPHQMHKWLEQYENIYLKPCSGSLGLGVMRLRQAVHEYEISRTENRCSCHYRVSENRLPEIQKRMMKRPYLIQEGIPLLAILEQPVDFRVSAQKGAAGQWEITGIVAKVGSAGAHATNLAVGGRAVDAQEVLAKVFDPDMAQFLYAELGKCALQIAGEMESMGPHISDLGLDLAITQEGTIKFIEANGRDLRITFRNAQRRKMWRHTFTNPILYGLYLLGKKEGSDWNESHSAEC